MCGKVDYHIHTYYSDGTKSPTEVVQWAKEQGKTHIAITDHDGIYGIPEAVAAGEKFNINIIAGIEFSAETKEGIGLHILGYNIDIKNKALMKKCHELKIARDARNKKYIKALAEEGFPLAPEDLIMRKGQKFIGKPIIARAMVNKGYIKESNDAFDFVFSRTKLRGIKKTKVLDKEAINLIKETGGMAVLAHPGLIRGIGTRETKEFFDNAKLIIRRLKKMGLEGIECNYPKHSKEETTWFKDIANEFSLKVTTGSDYHG